MNIGTNISIEPFCPKSASNLKVQIKDLTLWISYETIIAFRFNSKMVISESIWNKTTSKHLNAISRDKKIRVNHSDFEKQLSELLDSLQISIGEN